MTSHEELDPMREVRAEIGRRLKNYYEASESPIPERLAEILKKIERMADDVPLRTAQDGGVMES